MSDDAEGLSYALAHGTGFRRDGVGSPWHERNWIGSDKYSVVPALVAAWKQAPVVFEWFGNHDYLRHSLPLPASLTSGEYHLAVSIVDPTGQRRPFRLAMNAPDEDGRHRVSRVLAR
jgi:hypothetical protein